jgi:hypothetical protein
VITFRHLDLISRSLGGSSLSHSSVPALTRSISCFDLVAANNWIRGFNYDSCGLHYTQNRPYEISPTAPSRRRLVGGSDLNNYFLGNWSARNSRDWRN